jgi:RNA polymerase sigma-70 factor, ECF subfamily
MSDPAGDAASTLVEPTALDVGDWYRRYGEAVFRRCLRLAGDHARAKDLLQETFLRVHRFKSSYRAEAQPLAWLFTIANRCFFDSLRKRKEEAIDRDELAAFIAEEGGDSVETAFSRHALVLELLGRVDDDVRDIVVHRYFDELDLEEIAALVGMNERTVRRKLEIFLEGARKVMRRL